ncbi:hypothetical protein K469DRAFT_693352 [Zopfia rhizophila CBS 207.26]|uniref:Uncharacterized protein n=1 Tax=Zopfia rhizophila CBS 207.26 TaxID=1314779 RepID=A0A6A6DQH6_9PEZI|nr:hypothetical protein K469DRAFT_693352 [Zopfia rhizophila CBS 207.26]
MAPRVLSRFLMLVLPVSNLTDPVAPGLDSREFARLSAVLLLGCLHLHRQSVTIQGRTLGSYTLEVYTLSRPLAAPLEVEEKGDTYAVSAYTAGLSTSRVRSSLLKEVREKSDTYAVYAFTADPSTSQVRSSPLGSAFLAYRHAHPSSPATILSLQVATSVNNLKTLSSAVHYL